MSQYAEDRIKEVEERKNEKLTDEVKDAIRDYYSSCEKEDMWCPVCQNKLKVGEWFTYEDVCGDSQSPKYECVNKGCDMHKYKSFWNYQGSFFGGDLPFAMHSLLFPDDKYAALNSISKKHEVTIYGKGMNSRIWLHQALCLWILQPYFEIKYEGDDWGNVLGKKYKLKFLKYDRQRKEYCTGYISGLHMLRFTFSQFRRARKEFTKLKTPFATKNFLEQYENRKWDKRWWHLFSRWYFRNVWDMNKNAALNMKRVWDIIEWEDVEFLSEELNQKSKLIIDFLETSNDKKVKEYKELAIKLKTNNENICQLKKEISTLKK